MQNSTSTKKKRRSVSVRWKIFACIFGVTAVFLGVLWLFQAVFFDAFYYRVKTNELREATAYVADNASDDEITSAINYLSGSAQMSIRVIDTKAFDSIYTSGETFGPVTYGIGVYELFGLYEEALENGGECMRYYEGNKDRSVTAVIGKNPDNHFLPPFKDEFKQRHTPSLFFNNDTHNDLVYARVKTLSNGSEIMVVGETRITPLGSTVSTLKYQLRTVTNFIIIISLIASFFVARLISKPIEKINSSAKLLATGKYDTRFDGKGYSEIEELNDTLNHTASELGKVEGLRRELMANVSHDMRTPLTMIVGYAEVMRDIPGENTPENVQVIIDETNRLTEFVNNILDLTKLQNGIEKLDISQQNLTEMLQKLISRYKMLDTNSGYIVEFDYDTQAFIECDATKMSQVILNLIDNAINYTGEDKTVKVVQQVIGEKVRVEVRDSGAGIPESELAYIWDRYYKSKKNHKRNVVGSGIGLSIVKEILTQHCASFGAESTKDVGTTFWFELPVKTPTPQ